MVIIILGTCVHIEECSITIKVEDLTVEYSKFKKKKAMCRHCVYMVFLRFRNKIMPGRMVHTFNLSTQEADLSKFEASLISLESSSIIELHNKEPCLKKTK